MGSKEGPVEEELIRPLKMMHQNWTLICHVLTIHVDGNSDSYKLKQIFQVIGIFN